MWEERLNPGISNDPAGAQPQTSSGNAAGVGQQAAGSQAIRVL